MKPTIGLLIILLACASLIACGGGGDDNDEATKPVDEKMAEAFEDLSDDEKEMMEDIFEQMEEAQEAMEDIDAKAAVELAIPEALEWDSAAKLYQVDADEELLPDGTSSQWSVYFAVQEDSSDTPGREQGKKFFAMILDGQIISTEAYETPDEISHRAECFLFVPDDWMNSDEAYTKCIEALETIYGAETQNGEVSYFECSGKEFYLEGPDGRHWETIPVWTLSYKIDDTYARADIHAVTGEVVELK